MTQKELNYVEDIVNHEKMIISILQSYSFDDEATNEFIDNQISEHEKLIKKFNKLLGGMD